MALATPPPTPPPVIRRVTVTALCPTLRENIGPAIAGLRVDDGVIAQGRALMVRIGNDAVVDPVNADATAGAGASSQLDDVQLGHVIHALAENLERVEALLADPTRFPDDPSTDDERALAAAKQRLEAVASEQRRALQILSGTLDANEMADIAAQCDPVDCGADHDTVTGPSSANAGWTTAPRLSVPELLGVEIRIEQNAESLVTGPVVDVVNRCRAGR